MGVTYKEMDFNRIIRNVGACCLGEESCGTCKKGKCLIGYQKACLMGCLKEKVTYVMDGQANIPLVDGKVYDKHDLIDGVAELLTQCKSCDKDHFDNCVINVLRNCYEILLFGEIKEYKGSTLLYLSDIRSDNEEIAGELLGRL